MSETSAESPPPRTTERVGVVMQGPLLSTGRTLRDVRKRDFECTSEIEKMYEQSEMLGIEFVLVTWKREEKQLLPNIPTNLIHQIAFPVKNLSFIFRNNWNNNNKYKQYYSTLAGVKELKKKGVTHIIKLRTDSSLNLSATKNFLQNEDYGKSPNKIFVPALNVEKPDLFIDYYFGGTIENVEKFLNVMLYEKELCSNVHFDTFYKYARSAQRLNLWVLLKCLYRTERVRPNQIRQNIIQKTWQDFLTPGPKKIFENYFWRGEIFGNVYSDDILAFDEDVNQNDIILTKATIQNILVESFSEMKVGEKIQLKSVPTLLVSSYLEDSLNNAAAIAYKINKKMRARLKQLFRIQE